MFLFQKETETLEKIFPRSPELSLRLANLYQKQKKIYKEIKTLEKIFPRSPELSLRLANLYQKQKKFYKELETLKQISKSSPKISAKIVRRISSLSKLLKRRVSKLHGKHPKNIVLKFSDLKKVVENQKRKGQISLIIMNLKSIVKRKNLPPKEKIYILNVLIYCYSVTGEVQKQKYYLQKMIRKYPKYAQRHIQYLKQLKNSQRDHRLALNRKLVRESFRTLSYLQIVGWNPKHKEAWKTILLCLYKNQKRFAKFTFFFETSEILDSTERRTSRRSI